MSKIDELIKLNEPYFHLALGNKSDFERFYSICKDVGKSNTVVKMIEGKKCSTLDGLYDEFSRQLQFPGYFGYNWAAFDECLNDLDWLSGDAYLLLLSDIDKVLISSYNSFKVFIKTISRSIDEWTEGRNFDSFPTPPTPFHIVFHSSKEKEGVVKTKLLQAGLRIVDTIELPVQ